VLVLEKINGKSFINVVRRVMTFLFKVLQIHGEPAFDRIDGTGYNKTNVLCYAHCVIFEIIIIKYCGLNEYMSICDML
jgi:hypothetical protein